MFRSRNLEIACRTAVAIGAAVAVTLIGDPAEGRETLPNKIPPMEVATSLVELGSREAGGATNLEARMLLNRWLEGWTSTGYEVPTVGSTGAVSGHFPGEVETEIVLTAHFDTVADSPGALDNASGTAVVVSSFNEIARSPIHRSLRAVFFGAEESSLEEVRSWIESRIRGQSGSMFAALAVDMVGASDADIGVIHPATANREGRWTITPVWLIHAVVKGTKAVDFPAVVSDRSWPVFAQLGLRVSNPRLVSESRSFLEAGIPALTLSDRSLTEIDPGRHTKGDTLDRLDGKRLERWESVLASTFLQIDHLRVEPLSDTEYLVAAGRVWIRRDLMWAGFVLWVALVFQGLPGRWRGTAASERKRRGRAYLPGFAFRMLFLGSVFLIPTIASVLLYPVAIVAVVPTRSMASQRTLIGVLSLLPLTGFTFWLALAQLRGQLILGSHALAPAILVLLVMISFFAWRVIPREGNSRIAQG